MTAVSVPVASTDHRVGWKVLRFLRAVGLGVLAGLPAGLAMGFGSRVAMRVAAMTEPNCARLFTENGNRCGQITLEGTMFLIVFGGIFAGVALGSLYAAAAPFVRRFGRWRGLAFGGGLLAVLGWMLLDPHNVDFTRFGHPWLNVAMFGALFLVFGLVVAPLHTRLDRAVPQLPLRRPVRVRTVLAAALGAVAAGPALFAVVAVGIGTTIMALLLLPLGAAYWWLVQGHERSDARGPTIAAALVLAAPLLVGTITTIRAVNTIL